MCRIDAESLLKTVVRSEDGDPIVRPVIKIESSSNECDEEKCTIAHNYTLNLSFSGALYQPTLNPRDPDRSLSKASLLEVVGE
jgi:hypothetical protein